MSETLLTVLSQDTEKHVPSVFCSNKENYFFSVSDNTNMCRYICWTWQLRESGGAKSGSWTRSRAFTCSELRGTTVDRACLHGRKPRHGPLGPRCALIQANLHQHVWKTVRCNVGICIISGMGAGTNIICIRLHFAWAILTPTTKISTRQTSEMTFTK